MGIPIIVIKDGAIITITPNVTLQYNFQEGQTVISLKDRFYPFFKSTNVFATIFWHTDEFKDLFSIHQIMLPFSLGNPKNYEIVKFVFDKGVKVQVQASLFSGAAIFIDNGNEWRYFPEISVESVIWAQKQGILIDSD